MSSERLAKLLTSGKARSLTKSANKNQLIHYSPVQGLKQLDPNQMGTSGVRGAQYKRGIPEHRSTFFYTANSKPEDSVVQNAKSKYVVNLSPEHKVYDLKNDPHQLVAEMKNRNNGAWNEDMLHGVIKEKGFHGVQWKMHDGTDVVQMYHPIDIHQEESLSKGVQSPSKHIGRKQLQDIKQDNYVGRGGKEYSQEETDDAIMHRKIAEADKMVAEANRIQGYKKKIAKSDEACHNEDMTNLLTKGFIRDAVLTGLVATSASVVHAPQDNSAPAKQTAASQPADFHGKMLRTIASVESNDGKNTQHAEVNNSMHSSSAYGKYGLMPVTIKETIKRDPKFDKHRQAVDLPDSDIHGYMDKNPRLENEIAASHLNRLRSHFGDNAEHIGAAWLSGIVGTKRMISRGVDLKNHWHVQKILRSFNEQGGSKVNREAQQSLNHEVRNTVQNSKPRDK